MAQRASKRLLPALILALAAAGCRRAALGNPCALHGLECQAPSGWKPIAAGNEPGTRFVFIHAVADPEIGANFPEIEGSLDDSAADEAAARASRRNAVEAYADDASFKAGEVKAIPAAGGEAWSYEVSRLESDEEPDRSAGARAPVVVQYRQETVLLRGGRKNYRLTFGAPAPIFDRERPAFERLLASLRLSR